MKSNVSVRFYTKLIIKYLNYQKFENKNNKSDRVILALFKNNTFEKSNYGLR